MEREPIPTYIIGINSNTKNKGASGYFEVNSAYIAGFETVINSSVNGSTTIVEYLTEPWNASLVCSGSEA